VNILDFNNGVIMSAYNKLAFRLFSQVSEKVSGYFLDVKSNLKRARIKLSVQEYISIAIMTAFIVFVVGFPILSFLFGLMFRTFLFSFISSFTVTIALTIGAFAVVLNYPKLIIDQKERSINNSLPFATLYLSTIASTKLPLHKVFDIFARFSDYGNLTKEVELISNEIELFGLDINTALERAIDRSPSKELKELLWGMLSTRRSGGDLHAYLREAAANLTNDYRRKLYEFSHQLTLYIEIYLTAIVVGAIFFTILTSIISGLGGAMQTSNIIVLQFLLIFCFMPMVSVLFIIFVKTITPGQE